MRRMIKRTEITIETVEITTTRRGRPTPEQGDKVSDEWIPTTLTVGGTAEPAETNSENEIE